VKKLVSWLKTAKWVLYLVLAGAGIILILFLRKMFSPSALEKGENGTFLPQVSQKLKDKVAAVEEDALKSRVEARVNADRDKEELERVLQIKEEDKRREELAALLRRL